MEATAFADARDAERESLDALDADLDGPGAVGLPESAAAPQLSAVADEDELDRAVGAALLVIYTDQRVEGFVTDS